MNLAIVCEGCGTIYRVLQQDDGPDVDCMVGERSEFWPDRYACPRCGGKAQGTREELLPRGFHTKDVVDLNVSELMAALYGLGLPEDHGTTLDEVRAHLTRGQVTKIAGSDISNTGRCSIDYLELADGVRIYMGASTHGAVVYRVVHPTSYTKRLMEESNGSSL